MSQSTTSIIQPPRIGNGDYLLAFAGAAIVSVASAWLAYNAALSSASTDMKGALEALVPLFKIRVAIAPIGLLFAVGMQCVIVWLVALAMGNKVGIKPISFRLFTIAPILETQSIVDAISLYTRGGTPATAHIPLGLDALIKLPPGKSAVLLYTLGLPSIIWCVLLAILLKKTLPISTFSAIVCAIAALAMSVTMPLLSM